MKTPPESVNYQIPFGDLVALGKALYLMDPVSLAEKGLSEMDGEAVQRVFEAVEAALEMSIGPDWLGELEDAEGEHDTPNPATIALMTEAASPETPFLKLVRTMK